MDNQIKLQLHNFCIINYNYDYNYVIEPGPDLDKTEVMRFGKQREELNIMLEGK